MGRRAGDHPPKGDDTQAAARTGSVMVRDAAGPPGGPSPNEHSDLVAESAVGAAEAGQPSVATESPRPARHGKPRRLLYLTLPGCWGALIFGCLSFTPSLLPRGGVIQGIVFGITAAIGYGLGVLAPSIWRAFADEIPGGRGAGPGSPSSSLAGRSMQR